MRGGRLTDFLIQHDLIDAPDQENLAIEPEDSAHNSEPRASGRRLRRSVRIDAEVQLGKAPDGKNGLGTCLRA